MKNRLLLSAAASLLMLACASGAKKPDAAKSDTTASAPRYTAEPGSVPVGVIPAGTLRDPQRNKDIELSIDYPTRGGPSPVIIFSHGLGSAPRDFTTLASYWASHGYVVIRPAHADARRASTLQPDNEQLGRQSPAEWRNRALDITFIIDNLAALEQQYPELQGKINRDQIGVGGYSFGAFTTMLVAGARTFVQPDMPASYRDARVKAALALSPQGPSPARGLTTASWTDVRIPAMYMTGTADVGVTEAENPQWRRQAFELSPAGDKWLVVVQGAGHLTFTGRSSAPAPAQQDPPVSMMPAYPADPRYPAGQQPAVSTRTSAPFDRDRMLFRAVLSISLAFWDTYLRNDTAGREYLNKLNTRSDLEVRTK